MKLSILICTMPKRRVVFQSLFNSLSKQIREREIEILFDSDMSVTTGAKRNKLIKAAQGKYVVFIDDDDTVSVNYVELILQALQSEPDAVGFKGWITFNGRNKKEWRISKDFPYTEQGGIYYRYNNHLSPVKKEIALKIPYPDQSFEEDFVYAKKLHETGLVKTEIYIDKYLYTYNYVTHK